MNLNVRSNVPWIFTLAILAGTAPPTAAEEPLPPLVGDRPDFTESARTIPAGHFQLEAGTTFADLGEADVVTVGELLLRMGLSRRWELRVGVGSWVDVDAPTTDVDGFADPSLEVKFRINPESERSAIAVLFGSTLPWGSDEIGFSQGQPFVKLLLERGLSDRLSIAGNVGYIRPYVDGDRLDQFAASLSLGISASERSGVYVEVFGFNKERRGGGSAIIGDTGFTWLLTPSFQLDVRVGTGLHGSDLDLLAGAGLVKRW